MTISVFANAYVELEALVTPGFPFATCSSFGSAYLTPYKGKTGIIQEFVLIGDYITAGFRIFLQKALTIPSLVALWCGLSAGSGVSSWYQDP